MGAILFISLGLIVLLKAFKQFQDVFHVHFIIDIIFKIGRLMWRGFAELRLE
jgi:hypothetical protein